MTRRFIVVTVVMLGVLAWGGARSSVTAADVRIGVNIGGPPVVVAPPAPVVIAPGVPVYYYGASYYTYYNGAWFVGPAYAGPWAYVPVARVPRAMVAVPGAYYRIPPGHGRHLAGPPPWAHEHRR